VRGEAQHHLALLERLAHQAELVLFEVAQAPVDELGAPRAGGAGEVRLLHQCHRQAPPRGVTGDAGAVDAAADDEEVDHGNFPHLSHHSSPNTVLVSVMMPSRTHSSASAIFTSKVSRCSP